MVAIDRKTILFPGFRPANDALRASSSIPDPDCAKRPPQTGLGIEYTTPQALIESRWNLWGDGRRPINDIQRILAIFHLLDRHGLESSFGTSNQISKLVKRGFIALRNKANGMDDLAKTDKAIVGLVLDYEAFLHEHGLVELDEMLDAIKEYTDFENILIDESCIMDEPLQSFFGNCRNMRNPFTDDSGRSKGADPLDVAFIKTEGTSVVEKAVYDQCIKSMAKGDTKIAVVTPSSLNMFSTLSDALCHAGAQCTRIDMRRFTDTCFGRFFMSACRLLALSGDHGLDKVLETSSLDWLGSATDIAISPYASIAPFDKDALSSRVPHDFPQKMGSSDLNTLWRADRLSDAATAVGDLRILSPAFARVEMLFSGESDPFAAMGQMEKQARITFDPISVSSEIKAINSVISLMESVSEFGMPAYYVALMAQEMAMDDGVSEAVEQKAPNACEIAFMGAGAIRNATSRFFDTVILADATDGFLNAKSSPDSTLSIAQRMGIGTSENSMERARNAFASSVAAAKGRFVAIFSAHDKNSEEAFTSFCLDEFIDEAFKGSVTSKDALNGIFPDGGMNDGISSVEYLRIGEEYIRNGVGKAVSEAGYVEDVNLADRGILSSSSLLPALGKAADLNGTPKTVISPSSIEGYLQCPYKWFIERVISPDSIDEGLSALNRGSFAHEVLEEFHGRMQKSIDIDPDNFDSIRKIFDEAYDDVFFAQVEMEPLSGRYVPINAFEDQDASKLKEDIFEGIIKMASFPDRFTQAASEYRLSPFGEDPTFIEYAGFLINGTVDRIDVDDGAGTFCILDYKGSLLDHGAGSSAFEASSDSDDGSFDENVMPPHVQTLIYAQAVKRLRKFGERCEGAFYVSYTPKPKDQLLVGSCPSSSTDLTVLSNSDDLVNEPFDAFLDKVEDACRRRMENISLNDIRPNPAGSKVCKYCPYATCPRRIA